MKFLDEGYPQFMLKIELDFVLASKTGRKVLQVDVECF